LEVLAPKTNCGGSEDRPESIPHGISVAPEQQSWEFIFCSWVSACRPTSARDGQQHSVPQSDFAKPLPMKKLTPKINAKTVQNNFSMGCFLFTVFQSIANQYTKKSFNLSTKNEPMIADNT
jgi:hypothetical protein